MRLKALGDHLSTTIPKEYQRLFREKTEKSTGGLFSNLYSVVDTFLDKSEDPMDAFPTRSLASRKQEDSLSLMPTMPPHILGIFCQFLSTVVLLNFIQNRRQNGKFETTSSSSPIFAFSNCTTFGQTQTVATVPLTQQGTLHNMTFTAFNKSLCFIHHLKM